MIVASVSKITGFIKCLDTFILHIDPNNICIAILVTKQTFILEILFINIIKEKVLYADGAGDVTSLI